MYAALIQIFLYNPMMMQHPACNHLIKQISKALYYVATFCTQVVTDNRDMCTMSLSVAFL